MRWLLPIVSCLRAGLRWNLAAAALLVAAITACGGGGGGNPAPQGLSSMAGLWSTSNPDGSKSYALVTGSGSYSVSAIATVNQLLGNGKLAQLSGAGVTLTGTTVAGNAATLVLPPNSVPTGTAAGPFSGSLSGTANSSGLGLTFTAGQETLSVAYTLDPAGSLSIDPTTLYGTYSAAAPSTSTGVAQNLTVTAGNSAGELNLSDSASGLTGTATQIGTSNAFTVNLTLSGVGYAGQGFVLPQAPGATTYNLVLITTGANNEPGAWIFALQDSNASLAGIWSAQNPDGTTNYALITGAGPSYPVWGIVVANGLSSPGKVVTVSGTGILSGNSITSGPQTYLMLPSGLYSTVSVTGTLDGSAMTLNFSTTEGASLNLGGVFALDPATTLVIDPANLVGTYSTTAANSSAGLPLTFTITQGTGNALSFSDTTGAISNGVATPISGVGNGFNVSFDFDNANYAGTGFALQTAPGASTYNLVVMASTSNFSPLSGILTFVSKP